MHTYYVMQYSVSLGNAERYYNASNVYNLSELYN